MSVQMVLLPVFVLVGLTFFLMLWMVTARTRAVKARETSLKDIAAGQPKYPARVAQIGNCFSNQFEVPLLFYFLIALALPLRRADLFIVLMSWVFVVTRFAHAGIFVTSNNIQQRSLAWFAGALVVLAMWIYFALKLLLLSVLGKFLNDSRCPALRRHRTDRDHRRATRSGRKSAKGMGHRAPLCRLGRPRGDCRPDLGRAAAAGVQRLADGRGYAARARARHAPARARHDDRGYLQFVPRRTICAGAAERGRALGADLALTRRCTAACCRRLSGMAGRASGKSVRRRPRGRSNGDGEPRAAGSPRQHAEGQSRKGSAAAVASRRGADAVVADRPAHRTRRRRPQSRHSRRGRFYKRRASKSRTRARNWRRCSRPQNPASR